MTNYAPAPDAPPMEWAIWYSQALKWFCFPLIPRSKLPLTPNGFHDASRDLEQIKVWWTEHPRAGIGIPAGLNELVILDFDPRHGGRESYKKLIAEIGPFPETGRVLTGRGDGGRHFYFHSSEVWRHRTILPGLDVQAGGCYVVGPPSIHPDSGKRYIWEILPS